MKDYNGYTIEISEGNFFNNPHLKYTFYRFDEKLNLFYGYGESVKKCKEQININQLNKQKL
jgi:hypothetical protein